MFGKKKKGKVKLDMSFEDAIDKALNTSISKLPEFNKPEWQVKLFHLSNKPWQELAAKLHDYQFGALEKDVAIMQSPTFDSKALDYFIVSASRVADKMILEYGGIELLEVNMIIAYALKNDQWKPFYGSKANLESLLDQYSNDK